MTTEAPVLASGVADWRAARQFPDSYPAYMQRTKRLFPAIF